MMIIEQAERVGCPNNVNTPIHPLHRLYNSAIDAVYNAAEKDSDGEMLPEVDKAFSALAYKTITDQMYLFYHGNSFALHGRNIVLATYFYRCLICGLILPANEVVR